MLDWLAGNLRSPADMTDLGEKGVGEKLRIAIGSEILDLHSVRSKRLRLHLLWVRMRVAGSAERR
jgi:hypothetical protein